MPHFRVHIIRTIREQNYFDIEAENAEQAERIAQNKEPSSDREFWDLLEK